MKYLGMCLNWKVVVGLALVALGIWTLAPNLIGSALPVLIVLTCPLSMLLMMRGMGNVGGVERNADNRSAARSMPLLQVQRLAELSAQVDDLHAAQNAIAHAIAMLEAETALEGRQGESAGREAEPHAPSTTIGV